MESLISTLLKLSGESDSILFENRLRINRLTTTSLMSPFLEYVVGISMLTFGSAFC